MELDKSDLSITPGGAQDVVRLPVHTQNWCQGHILDLDKHSPWLSYPFGLHPNLDLPWSIFISDDNLV